MREVQVDHGSRGSVSQLNPFYLVPSASISLQHLLSHLSIVNAYKLGSDLEVRILCGSSKAHATQNLYLFSSITS